MRPVGTLARIPRSAHLRSPDEPLPSGRGRWREEPRDMDLAHRPVREHGSATAFRGDAGAAGGRHRLCLLGP